MKTLIKLKQKGIKMKQDRRLNGWVLIASILGIIAGAILIGAGATLSILGFLKPEQISKIDEIVFFLNQKGFIDIQLKIFGNELLKTEFLYLFSGIIIAITGLIALIFAIVGLVYAKKRKVVRHKTALFIFTLIPLAIAGCAITYLVLENEIFKLDVDFINNIKYVCYALVGLFGVISIFNIMGILFGRSEKFMSNDNDKYAFDNSNLRNARANINNVVAQPQSAMASTQQYYQPNQQPVQLPIQGQPVQRTMPAKSTQSVPRPASQGQPAQRPMTRSIQAQAVQRPMQGQPVQRPMQGQPIQTRSQMSRSAQGQGARSMPATRPVGQAPRPASSQPVMRQGQNLDQPMPIRRPTIRRCPRCGKILNQNERSCSMCGYKILN